MREIRTSGLMSGERKRVAHCGTAPLLNSAGYERSRVGLSL